MKPMDMNEFALRAEAIRPKLYRTAVMYMGSGHAGADALDEAVYRALKACRKLRRPEYFDTWMTRILINTCCDAIKKRRREEPAEDLGEETGDGENPYDALSLEDAVQRLPKDLKDVLVLRYFSGYSVKETADILGIPQGTAAGRERRALKLLRLELGEGDRI